MWWMIGLASGGEVQVATRTPMLVVIDGQILEYPEGSMTVTARMLAGGSHKIEVKSLLGKLVTSSLVDVPADQQIRLEYADKQLTVTGMGALPQSVVVVAPVAQSRGEMSGEVFTVLLQQMSTANFSKDKLALLQATATRSRFTCAQLAALLGTFSFDNDRLEGAKILAPRVVDPENVSVIASVFQFSINRDAALALFR